MMIPGGWDYFPYLSPPTLAMTTNYNFVLCGKASVNGIYKLTLVNGYEHTLISEFRYY